MAGAGLLVVGVLIGAALIFGTLYSTGSLSPRTVIESMTLTNTATQTIVTTQTTTTTINYGSFGSFTTVVIVSIVPYTINHATILGSVTLQNTGNASTDADSMTLTYGGVTCAPVITVTTLTAGAGAINVPITAIGTCTPATAGEAFVGVFSLSYGRELPFSGTFT